MAILFHPNPGTVLLCNFDGLVPPEMVKTRPVVVISPRTRHRTGLCTVIPISTTAPQPVMPWHYQLRLEDALSPRWPGTTMWIKCDMIYTMGFCRLDRFHKRVEERRKYYDRLLSDEQYSEIMNCVRSFLAY